MHALIWLARDVWMLVVDWWNILGPESPWWLGG